MIDDDGLVRLASNSATNFVRWSWLMDISDWIAGRRALRGTERSGYRLQGIERSGHRLKGTERSGPPEGT